MLLFLAVLQLSPPPSPNIPIGRWLWAVDCGGHPVPRSRCIDALVRSSWLIKFLCRGYRLSHLIRQGRSCKAHLLKTVMHPISHPSTPIRYPHTLLLHCYALRATVPDASIRAYLAVWSLDHAICCHSVPARYGNLVAQQRSSTMGRPLHEPKRRMGVSLSHATRREAIHSSHRGSRPSSGAAFLWELPPGQGPQ